MNSLMLVETHVTTNTQCLLRLGPLVEETFPGKPILVMNRLSMSRLSGLGNTNYADQLTGYNIYVKYSS